MKSHKILALVAAILLAGCEQPFDRTPPGFKEACYGGDDWKRNTVCSERRLVISTHASESEWPLLGNIVAEAGRSRSLKTFDVSSNIPGYVRTLEVYACSADGVVMSLDKRVHERAGVDQDGDSIRVEIRTYKNSYDWEPLAATLTSAMESKWPRPSSVERPAPLGGKRALPDSAPDCEE